jgi:hypothetical protein
MGSRLRFHGILPVSCAMTFDVHQTAGESVPTRRHARLPDKAASRRSNRAATTGLGLGPRSATSGPSPSGGEDRVPARCSLALRAAAQRWMRRLYTKPRTRPVTQPKTRLKTMPSIQTPTEVNGWSVFGPIQSDAFRDLGTACSPEATLLAATAYLLEYFSRADPDHHRPARGRPCGAFPGIGTNLSNAPQARARRCHRAGSDRQSPAGVIGEAVRRLKKL